MFFWLIVGIVLGYVLKPQLDVLVGKVIRRLKDKNHDKWDDN